VLHLLVASICCLQYAATESTRKKGDTISFKGHAFSETCRNFLQNERGERSDSTWYVYQLISCSLCRAQNEYARVQERFQTTKWHRSYPSNLANLLSDAKSAPVLNRQLRSPVPEIGSKKLICTPDKTSTRISPRDIPSETHMARI